MHILGLGSIGGLFAARLAAARLPVTVLLRHADAQAAWQTAGGIRVEGPGDARMLAQPTARPVSGDIAPPAHLLVTTKAQDTLTALAPLIAGDGRGQLVVLLQNGMGVSEVVRARWPGLRIWNAVTTAGVWRSAPFTLHCVANGETHAGRWDDAGDAHLDTAVQQLADNQILMLTPDIRTRLWHKLAVNAVINALTAIHACRNGALLEIPEARAQVEWLARETERVAAAEGIRFDESVLAMAERVIRQTADNFSSMNRDAAAGRGTEIAFINGYVVDCARRHGIDVPANESVLHALL